MNNDEHENKINQVMRESKIDRVAAEQRVDRIEALQADAAKQMAAAASARVATAQAQSAALQQQVSAKEKSEALQVYLAAGGNADSFGSEWPAIRAEVVRAKTIAALIGKTEKRSPSSF
jgi:hypothetical protein